MLRRWSLAGFKAFGELTTLHMAPLTILAGANSSGKSTILQSVLWLKQTIQYGAPARPLALNGPLIRLGTFDDVIHAKRQPSTMSIGFVFDFTQTELAATDRATWLTALSNTF